jgi:hypothetical protein
MGDLDHADGRELEPWYKSGMVSETWWAASERPQAMWDVEEILRDRRRWLLAVGKHLFWAIRGLKPWYIYQMENRGWRMKDEDLRRKHERDGDLYASPETVAWVGSSMIALVAVADLPMETRWSQRLEAKELEGASKGRRKHEQAKEITESKQRKHEKASKQEEKERSSQYRKEKEGRSKQVQTKKMVTPNTCARKHQQLRNTNTNPIVRALEKGLETHHQHDNRDSKKTKGRNDCWWFSDCFLLHPRA